MELETAFEPIVAEMRELLPAKAVVVDAHTHLGKDEDGQSLEPGALRRAALFTASVVALMLGFLAVLLRFVSGSL